MTYPPDIPFPPTGNKPEIYSVTQITRRIRFLLEDQIGEVHVEGEVSNARFPPSGHWYFTLKDESAQIDIVLFRGAQRGAPRPRDGMQARVTGPVGVYERQGRYQIVARRFEEAGRGALHAAFEELKEKLRREGLFDEGRKKPLPILPQRIGVVTSPTGAAIRDMLQVLERRFPNLPVLLAPARVQGEGAAREIAEAVDRLNEYGGVDVLIVGRGGGSLEDLWCFNEEIVARAIARSRIPVISAVGHEIDFTISDFVADLRAPTPSAAAELVVGRKEDFEQRLHALRERLKQALVHRRLEWRRRYERLAHHAVFREPQHRVRSMRERLAFQGRRLTQSCQARIREERQHSDELALRLRHAARTRLDEARRRQQRIDAQLRALDPAGVLRRGFSITTEPDGKVLRDVSGLSPGAHVQTRLAKGKFESTIIRVIG